MGIGEPVMNRKEAGLLAISKKEKHETGAEQWAVQGHCVAR